MPVNRKLAAIFYTDVVAYSRLTTMDEEGTHARVMAMLDMAAAAIDASNGSVLRLCRRGRVQEHRPADPHLPLDVGRDATRA